MTPSKPIPSWLITAFLVVSVTGFADAAYLAAERSLGKVPPCSILNGCEIVTLSRYSTVAGIPIALFGALYYLSMIIATLVYLDNGAIRQLYLAAYITILGLLASVVLVGIQLFVLKAICIYCMFSALTSTILWFLGIMLLKYNHDQHSAHNRHTY